MIKDAQGQAVSGATAAAVTLYDQAARAFNLGYGDSAGLFDAAREASPDFAMAHLAKAWLFALANDPIMLGRARAAVQDAAGLKMNEREQGHFAALQQAVAGARGAAASVLDRHLMRYPFDLIAHQAVTLLDGYLGRFRWVRDRTARALPLWSKDMPGYAAILAFHGFGLEEAGDYSRAEDESRAAAELEPHSFWPHHTVAHVMEMTGRPEDGLGWMIAREPFWSAPDHPGPYLVAQVAVPSGAGTIRGSARAVRRALAAHAAAPGAQSVQCFGAAVAAHLRRGSNLLRLLGKTVEQRVWRHSRAYPWTTAATPVPVPHQPGGQDSHREQRHHFDAQWSNG